MAEKTCFNCTKRMQKYRPGVFPCKAFSDYPVKIGRTCWGWSDEEYVTQKDAYGRMFDLSWKKIKLVNQC